MHLTRHLPEAHTLARAFGWFSLALGATELLMPGPVARGTGLHGRHMLLRAYGVREIVTGIGLLTSRRPGLWMWARVVGDAVDAGTLARGRGGVQSQVSLGIVAAVAAADIACAAALSRRPRAAQARHDYSDRSGLPQPPSQMRGVARGDFEVPRDMQSRPRVRPYTPDPAAGQPQEPGASGPRWNG